MKKIFKNKYFLLRHGKNIHQTEKKDFFYNYPDDNPPCELIPEGIKEVENAGAILNSKAIDLIISSDIFRTKQTAEIIARIINYNKDNIKYDSGLRDINWGIYSGKKQKVGWNFYNNDALKRFDIAPEGGESWQECQQRMINVLEELEKENANKNILIISHGDPLWLLEGYILGKSKIELSKEMGGHIKTGEVREF
ncbi:MAG: histidine phosphatase family protein [Candidatus Pacebacteria bacterium]|nr:histidine phosphatase family protein [Candidatus Paceibacterota bacterium]